MGYLRPRRFNHSIIIKRPCEPPPRVYIGYDVLPVALPLVSVGEAIGKIDGKNPFRSRRSRWRNQRASRFGFLSPLFE